MRARALRVVRAGGRLHGPRTVRLRLTLLFGGVFCVTGAILLGITYLLVRHATADVFVYHGSNGLGVAVQGLAPAPTGAATATTVGPGVGGMPSPTEIALLAHQQRADQLHALVVQSGIALAIMACVSLIAGWLVAGRVLRPLRTITNAAREISASNLHRRLALGGPRDELRELGDTFDGLLARLERAFAAQRQFIANASHELRTPLTLERAILEVALADPDADAASLRRACEQVLGTADQQERLIEALLTLARSQRGLDRSEPVDLAAAVEDAVAAAEAEACARGVPIHAALECAPADGDARLVERLVANLVDNAVRHNAPGGRVEVVTGTRDGRALLVVTNDGPVVAPGEVARLLQPFARAEGEREAPDGGLGLGLSIVAAIAEAHRAALDVRARAAGGLHVEVRFPEVAVRPPQRSGDRTAVTV